MLLASCRPAPEASESATETIPGPPPRDIKTDALWSPDTPEYIPQYTCQLEEPDNEAGQAASEPNTDQAMENDTVYADAGVGASDALLSGSRGTLGYGSSSVAPFAFRRTGR